MGSMIANTFRHFNTITKHRRYVRRHCRKCGIGFQGLFHDLSKYSHAEFWAGVRYYQGTRSPNDKEREELGYSLAWMHHKGRNKHHFEYWSDFDPVTHKTAPVEMPVRYVVEMLCDRVAASKIYHAGHYTDADSLEYFLQGKSRRFIHPATSDLLEGWLTLLAQEGEKAAFKQVRKAVRADRKKRRKDKAALRKANRRAEKEAKKSAREQKKNGKNNTESKMVTE